MYYTVLSLVQLVVSGFVLLSMVFDIAFHCTVWCLIVCFIVLCLALHGTVWCLTLHCTLVHPAGTLSELPLQFCQAWRNKGWVQSHAP